MKMFKIMCILAVLVATCAVLHGQAVNPSDVGFVPAGMYQHTDIDSVNMANGNAVIHIPLFGYPQLGSSLKLDYSIIANTSLWQPNIVCYPDGAGGSICENTYTMGNTPVNGGYTSVNPCGFVPNASPAITYLQSATWCEDFMWGQNCYIATDSGGGFLKCEDFLAAEFNVEEPTGEEHRLQYDASNLSNLRTTDGSGYRLQVDDPQPYFPYYPSGGGWALKDIWGSVLTDSKGINLSANVLADLNGNTIRSNGPNGIVDTVQRPIPFPPLGPTSNSTQGCPTLNAQYQPAIGSATWTVPGPNGQPTTFLLCFANVAYQTNFWSYGPRGYTQQSMDGNGNMSINVYSESSAAEIVLQSVVLPDTNYWGFTYDAANPSDPSSIAYGTLTGILTPQKSSISYQYTPIADCGVYIEGEPVYVQRISQRTLTDADGNTAIWKYNFNFPLDGATYPLQSISTDPYGNDTVYGYKTYRCQTLPATTVRYAGLYSQNHVLRTENTDYQTVTSLLPTPYDTEDNIYANSFPKTVTEIDEAGNQAKTTYSYDPGFISAAPYCYTGYTYTYYYNGLGGSPENALDFCTISVNTLPVSFGLQTSKSVFNYDGTPVASDTTTYKWQDGSLSSNPYYAGNLLTLPCLQSVYSPSQPAGVPIQCAISAQTNLLAETSYGYDEPNGSPSGIRGNQTSVSRWLNTGGDPVKTTAVYNSQGMPTDTYDGNLNAGLPGNHVHTTYDSTGIFPSSLQLSSTGSTAHIDYYSYDLNTGNVRWHTDQNGAAPTGNTPDPAHTASYSYDFFGRPTQILGPPTPAGQGETDIVYDDTALTVTTHVHADPNPQQTSVKQYDSLGRLHQTTAANNAIQITHYNLMNRVLSVSNPYIPPAGTDGYTTYSYDPLGRNIYQCNPDNGTGFGPCTPGGNYLQWSCAGNVTTSYDELRNATRHTADALGRLIQVTEPGPLTTNYSYDALSNLLSVSQLGNSSSDTPRTRSFTYDSLSRLIQSYNPETGWNCYGQWSYAGCVNGYDADDNLKYKTDARGVTTNYAYDNLNRLLAKTYTNAPAGSLSSCYAFDTATNGISKLGVEWTTAGSCSSTSGYQTMRQYIAYDSMGRLWNEQQCVLGHCTNGPTPPCAVSGNNAPYYQTYCYDLAGNMIWNTSGNSNVPGANTIGFSYTYDAGGQLSTLGSTWSNGLHPSPLFTAAPTNGYSPAGALQNFTLGNSISVIKTYDNRLRTTGETATQQ
jgi:YD repeat-containing protein